MKGKKPTSCLVHTFGNIIGRVHLAEIILILKRVMNLSVWHGSRVEPPVNQISLELRNQYVLGFYPSNRIRDGKWRKLKIHLTGPASQGKVRLYARKGYYGPAE